MSVSSRILALAMAGLLVFTGCRTYGNEKYETGPKTYQAIQKTVQRMEQELGRAQSDLRRLDAAAEQMDTLRALAARYRGYVASHEAALAGHREQAERLTAESSYRSLHRSYGAMIMDRRLLSTKYRRAVRHVWAAVRDTTLPPESTRDPSRYVVTPVNFPRVGQGGALTMADALRALEGTPGLQPEETTESE
jgi:hypothetical protein